MRVLTPALALLFAAVLVAGVLIAPHLWTAMSDDLPHPCLDSEPAHALPVCDNAIEPIRAPAKGALAPAQR